MGQTITITEKELKYLRDRSEFLECLEACGVDNWDGYGGAHEMYNGAEEDTESITCVQCGMDKEVEKGTWALEFEMCSPCYCAHQGG